ncbi:MAG: nicotinate-nucleotide--dimethylbenzimidazole phosphoribosyltransferase [Spirochaetaceae bacterium]|jgi:nicotinate-nucleotide--dimethylbenzimidazole phosphoribosyltransferase|nr:nicotinate-nucleotide--dimethylbenzimidazole phosphoribosyltransferase [Spirochaetaceae bacterium]
MDGKNIRDIMQAYLDNLTKPRGSLGKLEDYCIKMAQIQGKIPPKIEKKGVYVFGGDHGIAEEGVSLYPKEVSFQMAMNMLTGGAGINALADATAWDVNVIDCGIAVDFPPDNVLNAKNRLIRAKINHGSKNFYKESAMTEEEVEASINKGKELADDAEKQGYSMVAIGDLGIGNTSTAAALLIAAGMEADSIIDRGTGISNEQLTHKKRVIKEGVAKRRPVKNAYSILQEVGAPDLAMMTGFILGLEGRGIGCVLDGFPVTSAAYMAYMINPKITEYLFAGHLSKVAGHKTVLSTMGLNPVVNLEMHLGEGTGAVIGGFIIGLGVSCALNMANFDNTDVSGKDAEEQKY